MECVQAQLVTYTLAGPSGTAIPRYRLSVRASRARSGGTAARYGVPAGDAALRALDKRQDGLDRLAGELIRILIDWAWSNSFWRDGRRRDARTSPLR